MECKKCGKILQENDMFFPWPYETVATCGDCSCIWDDFMHSREESKLHDLYNAKLRHFEAGGLQIDADNIEMIINQRNNNHRELLKLQREFFNHS
jgi:hypothetical protein